MIFILVYNIYFFIAKWSRPRSIYDLLTILRAVLPQSTNSCKLHIFVKRGAHQNH
jgi:hypothetical protein